MSESILNTALRPHKANNYDFDYRAFFVCFGKPQHNHVHSIMTGIIVQQFPIWGANRMWGMLGEDVGSRELPSSSHGRVHGVPRQTYATPYSQRKCSNWELLIIALLLPLVLSGCLAQPIKVPAYKTAQLRRILVVPIETPPLEIIPDPINERLPVLRNFLNMENATPLLKKIYLNPGNLLVSGLISNEDVVAEFAFDNEHLRSRPSLSPLGQDYWLPSLALAENLVTQFTFNNIKSQLSRHYYRLPSSSTWLSSDPADWRKSVSQWYEQTQSSIDFRSIKDSAGFDAILEIGIGHYRIFEGQTALQILMRLVDPVDGKVFARTSAETYTVSGTPQSLLDNDGQRFKQLITDMGMRLVDRGLGNIGLPLRKTTLHNSKIPFVEAPPDNAQF